MSFFSGSPSSHIVSDIEYRVSHSTITEKCHHPCTSMSLEGDGICVVNQTSPPPTQQHSGHHRDTTSESSTSPPHLSSYATSSSSSIHSPLYHYFSRSTSTTNFYTNHHEYHQHGPGGERYSSVFSLWTRHRTPWLVALQLVLMWFMQTLAHHRGIGLT